VIGLNAVVLIVQIIFSMVNDANNGKVFVKEELMQWKIKK